MLIDGFWQGMWRIARQHDSAVLVVDPFIHLSSEDSAAVADEGARLLAFAAAGASHHDVRIAPMMAADEAIRRSPARTARS